MRAASTACTALHAAMCVEVGLVLTAHAHALRR